MALSRLGLRSLADDPPLVDCELCAYLLPEWRQGICVSCHGVLVRLGVLPPDAIPSVSAAPTVVAQPGRTAAPAPSPAIVLGRRRPGPEVSG